MKFLITGGAGYIGSTVASALEDAGHTPIILDSLVTGRQEFTRDRIFYRADIADREVLQKIFQDHPDIEAALHCAALIIVPESVEQPYLYYRENVAKSLELFMNLHRLGCNKIVFSSSASVYDHVPGFMVTEESAFKPELPVCTHKINDGNGLEGFLQCLWNERDCTALFQSNRCRPENAFRYPCERTKPCFR